MIDHKGLIFLYKRIKIPFKLILIASLLIAVNTSNAQISIGDDIDVIDYSLPHDYEIGGITVSGIQYLDQKVLVLLSGLKVGETVKVPGQEVTDAIKKLWDQGLFENIVITATKIQGDVIFLNIHLQERPRLSKFSFKGVKKTEADKLRENMHIARGDVVTDNLLVRVDNVVKDYYHDKGFLNAEVDIKQIRDTTRINNVDLVFNVKKNERIKIYQINIQGNENLSNQQIKKILKETKEKGLFNPMKGMDKLLVRIFKDLLKFDFIAMYSGTDEQARPRFLATDHTDRHRHGCMGI